MNVCGILVHAMPSRLSQVIGALRALEGVDIHQTAPGGRVVVTVEDTAEVTALDAMASIHRLDGVVAASLIYHHFEPDADGAAATA